MNRKEWSQPALREPVRAFKLDDPYNFEGNAMRTVDARPFGGAVSTQSQEGSRHNDAPDSPASGRPGQKQDAAKKRLVSLINNCNTLQKHTIRNLNKLEVQRQSQNQINSALDNSIEMLKDLELIESSMIQTVYEYNKLNAEEMKATTREVVLEHRSGQMDPAAGKLSKTRSKKARQQLMARKQNA